MSARSPWIIFFAGALFIAALSAAPFAAEPKKEEDRKGRQAEEIPVTAGPEELTLGELRLVFSKDPPKAKIKFEPKDAVPEAILQQCRDDIKASKPPYPSIDVSKLALTEIYARNKIDAWRDKTVKNEEIGVCYITFRQMKEKGTAGSVVYVYCAREKRVTRKFWTGPTEDK